MKKNILIAVVLAAVAVAGGTAYWFFIAGKTAPEDQAQTEQAAEDASGEASEESKNESEESAPEDDAEKKEKAEVEEIVTADTLEEALAENPDGTTRFSSKRLEKAHELALEEIVKQKEAELQLMKDETPKAMEKAKMGRSIEGWLDRTK